jgi:hypothetical protein
MSEIITDNLTGKTAAGNVTITSEGGSATMQLQQGVAKNWSLITVSGGTPSSADSLNTASLTDDSTGNVFINLTNAMSSVNYSNHVSGQRSSSAGTGCYYMQSVTSANRSTSLYRINNIQNGSDADPVHYDTQVNGDLA